MDSGRQIERLCAAAARLFARRGYHGTTIREIAREVDLQGGSLYAHIAGKEDLLWLICQRAARQFHAAVAPIAAGDLPPEAKLRAAFRAHVAMVASDLDAATVYFHEWRFLGPERLAVIAERRDAYEALFRAIVEAGRHRGDFAVPDAKFPTLLVLSAGNWLAQWFRPGGELDAEAVADRLVDLILHGITGAGAAAGPHLNGTARGTEAAEEVLIR